MNPDHILAPAVDDDLPSDPDTRRRELEWKLALGESYLARWSDEMNDGRRAHYQEKMAAWRAELKGLDGQDEREPSPEPAPTTSPAPEPFVPLFHIRSSAEPARPAINQRRAEKLTRLLEQHA